MIVTEKRPAKMCPMAAKFLGLLPVLLLIGGCVSSSEIKSPQSSVGQQLMDLQHAYQKGIISEKEYDRLRKAIIKEND